MGMAKSGFRREGVICREAIHTDLRAVNREEAIRQLLRILAAAGEIQFGFIDEILESVLLSQDAQRKSFGTAEVPESILVPYAKHHRLTSPTGAVGVFSVGHEAHTLAVILLLFPIDQPNHQLRTLESIRQLARDPKCRKRLLASSDAKQIVEIMSNSTAQTAFCLT